VIDCEIHPQIGDPEELLAHVETGQRDWFRGQPYFGLPGYSWSHPSSWYRQDLAAVGGPPERMSRPSRGSCSIRAEPASES